MVKESEFESDCHFFSVEIRTKNSNFEEKKL